MACNWLSFICIDWCLLVISIGPVPGSTAIQDAHTIRIVGDNFMIDGEPLHVMSGSVHYFRVPAVYWRDRLHKLKAAGLNAVATYVEWSYHEPEERQYSFEGDRDLAAFIKLAAEEGLHVLLRPGPYICAERDLGGLPYWLLGKYPKIRLRSADSDFMNETTIWMAKLFTQISPLLFGNGGPIILVQVENEFGSPWADVKHRHHEKYKIRIRDVFKQHVGDKAILFTTDGSSRPMIETGAIPQTLTTIDFGPTNTSVMEHFNILRKFMPRGPLMNSEYYVGWMTHWGETQQVVPTDRVVHVLSDMLNQSINFNIYMFFGGTNYEFTSGATVYNKGKYLPVITSYDYDAPLNESGDPTPKYFAIREAIAKYNPRVNDIDAPTSSRKGAYGTIYLHPRVSLLSSEGRSSLGKSYPGVTGSQLPTFEKLRQRAGLMLYETIVGKAQGFLKIAKPRDRVYVYVNGVREGVLNRMRKVYSMPLNTTANSVLSLLVEHQGRANYGLLHDPKGILSKVTYAGETLNGSWSVTGFPLEKLDAVRTINSSAEEALPVSKGPVLYEGSFVIPDQQKPLDTFLDPTGWGKGYIWVNGHNLGRYWPRLGSQVTLYLPGCWLRPSPALNIVQLLELQKTSVVPTVRSTQEAFLNGPARNERNNDCFNIYLIFTLTFTGIIIVN